MAKGEKTGGKDFQPGQSGNPKGRPRDPLDLHLVKSLNQGDFKLIIQRLLDMSPEELASHHGTSLEMVIKSGILKAIETGDLTKLQSSFDRLFGKVTEKLEVDARHEIVNQEQEEKKIQELIAKINAANTEPVSH